MGVKEAGGVDLETPTYDDIWIYTVFEISKDDNILTMIFFLLNNILRFPVCGWLSF